VFQKELYSFTPNVTMWRVLTKTFALKGVQGVERWIVTDRFRPRSRSESPLASTANIPVTIVTNQHGGRKDNTIILTNGQLAISTTSGEAHV
jgi:hypothetical protein